MPHSLTIDSGAVEDSRLIAAARARGVDLAVVTVTERELGDSSFAVHIESLERISEPGVWGEGAWGKGTWGGGTDVEFLSRDGTKVTGHPLEELLAIVANGSFPPPHARTSLSKGQRNQLRDAMIICAHLQHGRTVFVTRDAKAFVNNGRREELERRFGCRIMTPEEATNWLQSEGAA